MRSGKAAEAAGQDGCAFPSATGLPGADQLAEAAAARWIAVNTHPHRERFALEHLGRQGYVAYCPMIQRQIRHARRTKEVLRPLFPSYLFVRINPELQRWRPILSTYGVRTLVRNGDRLGFVEDGLIESLRAREMDGVITRPAEPFRMGQQVRMRGGPFDGLVATIIEMDEKDRLVVLMDLLNQSVKVKVAAIDVRAG